MRILIALQAAAAATAESLKFLQVLCRNRGGHEVILVLDGQCGAKVELIRGAFEGVLQQSNIRLWYTPAAVTNSPRAASPALPENLWQHRVGELLKGELLASLEPDVVLVAEKLDGSDLIGIIGPIGIKGQIGNIVPIEPALELQARSFIELLEEHHANRRDDDALPLRRPKLAFLSPLPPERSGISDYSAELLPELSRFYEIDVVVEQEAVSDHWITAHCPVRSVSWFREHKHEYDRVLYHIGNSPFHLYMFDLLAEIPGVVVLHDFFLSDILEYRDCSGMAPGSFPAELYHAHGYPALQKLFAAGQGSRDVVGTYPCNFSVLRNASGVILHSGYALSLAGAWYDKHHSDRMALLPLMRTAAPLADKGAARRALGLADNDIVVCSFGLPDSHKLSRELLEAWQASGLMHDRHCTLLYVGELLENDYCKKLEEDISHSAGRISMTGWVPLEKYRLYLAAADIGVQLRSLSRGESSASALDCMNYGLATIVNANGSMAELPAERVMLLPDKVTVEQLKEALEALHLDAPLRERLGSNARDYIKSERSPARIAERYAEAIERFSQGREIIRYNMQHRLSLDTAVPENNAAVQHSIAKAVTDTFPSAGSRPQLLLDVSGVVAKDLKTGIQRLVRSVVMELLEHPPLGYRVEPVFMVQGKGGVFYRYAQHFTMNLLGKDSPFSPELDNEPVEIHAGDIFLGLDLCHNARYAAEFVQRFKAAGGRVYFVVYDLLPLQFPHYFLPDTEKHHQEWMEAAAQGDGVLCISRSVADDVKKWFECIQPLRYRPFTIGWFHLGADIDHSIPSTGIPEGFEAMLQRLSHAPIVLMVGTVEPRKGYEQVVTAFELLWMIGVPLQLVIAGKAGWMVEQLTERLRGHKELNRRLFWFESFTDEALMKLYAAADGLIMASEGEGFGLPIIEAARYGCPILMRDIPVFREIAGENATYFSGTSPLQLADSVKMWMANIQNGSAPQSSGIPLMTWKESADQVKNLLTDDRDDNWVYRLDPAPQHQKQQQLLLDVSALVGNDLKTGIQRVVRSVVMELLEHPPEGFRIEPVVMEKGILSVSYSYASEFNLNNRPARKELVQIDEGDIFLGLDLCHNVRFGREYFEGLKQQGCKVYFVVYDLLPLLFPHYFPPDIEQHHLEWMEVAAQGDGVLCISRAVADDVKAWFERAQPVRKRPFSIGWFHLGADIENSLPTAGVPEGFDNDLLKLAAAPTILMVGTVEPRKGCGQVLNAFKLLWLTGMKVNLVLVGKQGWMVEKIAERLTGATRNGRLFWYQGISDEALQKLYAAADGVIMASMGEGFGLPLIEAAQHKCPILARDLPVFREVAGVYATYFSGTSPLRLARVVKKWIANLNNGSAPQSSAMPWMTWKESTSQIVALLTESPNNNWIYKLEVPPLPSLQQAAGNALSTAALNTIAVDITPVLPGGENGGAKVFVLELLGMLAEMKPETKFILLTRESSHEELAFLDRANMQRLMILKEVVAPVATVTVHTRWINRTIARWKKSIKKRIKNRAHPPSTRLRDLNVDLLFCPFTSPDNAEPGIPVVSTIYDLQYKTYPEFFSPEDVAHRDRVFMNAVQRADALTAISEYSRQSAIAHGACQPARIRTIYLRMAHRISLKNSDDNGLLARYGLVRHRYLLYTANFWKHKNHEKLLAAFGMAARDSLSPDIKLVCTGAPGERQRELIRVAESMGLEDRVIFPGYLPNDELALILSNCTALIFPSLYEGFGLPVIEAMKAGVPVACSNTRSLPEIAANAALFFDPLSPEQIAWSMLLLCKDEKLRSRLVKAGDHRAEEFSDQKRMAREYWELFEQAMNKPDGLWRGAWAEWREDEQPFVEPYSRLKVSIVTPSFNQGEFIERTLLSVAKQQGAAIEHVVIDGGSSDNTVEILRKFRPAVQWVSEKDNGQTNAVNKGIQATDGDIIGWLNSDDIYYPNAIAKVTSFFEANPDVDVVYGQADHIDVHDWPFESYPTEPFDFARLHDTSFICQPALFFRRRVVEQHGLLDESLHYCMDYEYWLRLGKAGVRFAYLEEKLAGSRLYAENKTLGAKVKVHREINNMFKHRFGRVPKRWLKNYAHITMHDRLGGRHTSHLEFDFRYFFAKLRWGKL